MPNGTEDHVGFFVPQSKHTYGRLVHRYHEALDLTMLYLVRRLCFQLLKYLLRLCFSCRAHGAVGKCVSTCAKRKKVGGSDRTDGSFSSHSKESYSCKRRLLTEHQGKETWSTMASTCQDLDYIIQIQIHFSAWFHPSFPTTRDQCYFFMKVKNGAQNTLWHSPSSSSGC